mmetsp:Transcript_12075/g.18073  ORF Transcript_12075/g.18073 Transcript_12075/m.18073 type:complete len:88 (-) Transcript_12075:433-696(-)
MKIPIAVILATTEFTFQAAAVQTEPIPTSLDTNLVGYTNASEASIPKTARRRGSVIVATLLYLISLRNSFNYLLLKQLQQKKGGLGF